MGKKSKKAPATSTRIPDWQSAQANRIRHSFALIATASDDHRITDADRELYARLSDLASDPAAWSTLSRTEMQMLVYQQILESAWNDEGDVVFRVADLYKAAMKRLSTTDRQYVAEEVATKYALFGNSFGRLFAPWSMTETEPGVIAKASLDFAQYFNERKEDGSTMHGVEALAMVIRNHVTIHPGATLGGLLMLGDRRYMQFLDGIWTLLNPDDELELTRTGSGFMYAATIDFLLDWMEAVDDSRIGYPSTMLAQLRKNSVHDTVYEIERDLPVSPHTSDGVVRFVNQWSAREYGQMIAPRLQALADREKGEIVIPLVMHAWGVEWKEDDPERRALYEKSKSRLNYGLGQMKKPSA